MSESFFLFPVIKIIPISSSTTRLPTIRIVHRNFTRDFGSAFEFVIAELSSYVAYTSVTKYCHTIYCNYISLFQDVQCLSTIIILQDQIKNSDFYKQRRNCIIADSVQFRMLRFIENHRPATTLKQLQICRNLFFLPLSVSTGHLHSTEQYANGQNSKQLSCKNLHFEFQ